MSKEMSVILLGIFVAVLPQLGFPSDWKVVMVTVAGILIALIGFLLRGKTLSQRQVTSESKPTPRKREIPPVTPEV